MPANYLITPALFLIDTLFGLYIFAVLLRFMLQWAGADYYNPISRFIVKVTHPPLRLLRRVIPAAGRVDTASLVLMLALQMLAGYLLFALQGAQVTVAALAVWALVQLLEMALNVLFFVIMISVILSWVSPRNHNPGILLISGLAEFMMAPVRRWLPNMGGFDLTPMIPLIGIELCKMLVLPPLHQLFLYLNL